MSEEQTGWTCYHCGEHFITHTHAKLHFGIPHSGAQPACLIKADQGLVKYIRQLELRLGKAMEEDSDTLRDLALQRCETANAISVAEELGYSRGLGAYTKLESERDSLKQQLSEALAKLEKFEKMEFVAYEYTDAAGTFISRATCESLGANEAEIKVRKLYAHPQEAESDIEEQLRRT